MRLNARPLYNNGDIHKIYSSSFMGPLTLQQTLGIVRESITIRRVVTVELT